MSYSNTVDGRELCKWTFYPGYNKLIHMARKTDLPTAVNVFPSPLTEPAMLGAMELLMRMLTQEKQVTHDIFWTPMNNNSRPHNTGRLRRENVIEIISVMMIQQKDQSVYDHGFWWSMMKMDDRSLSPALARW